MPSSSRGVSVPRRRQRISPPRGGTKDLYRCCAARDIGRRRRADILGGARPSDIEGTTRPISRRRACAVGKEILFISLRLCVAGEYDDNDATENDSMRNGKEPKSGSQANGRQNRSICRTLDLISLKSLRSGLSCQGILRQGIQTTKCFSRHAQGTSSAVVVPVAHLAGAKRATRPGRRASCTAPAPCHGPAFPSSPAIKDALFFEVERGQGKYALRYLR